MAYADSHSQSWQQRALSMFSPFSSRLRLDYKPIHTDSEIEIDFDDEKIPQPSRTYSPRQLLRRMGAGIAVLIIGIASFLIFHNVSTPSARTTSSSHKNTSNSSKGLVVASYTTQNVSWLHQIPEDWDVYRYVMDNSSARAPYLTVPRNQGREAMAYLTFIIDHYDSLPAATVFLHGHESAWHQPRPIETRLQGLNMDALIHDKYMSLRCAHEIGCKLDEHIGIAEMLDNPLFGHPVARMMPGFWNTMFPPENNWGMGPPPAEIGSPCCAQFVVSRDAITARPLAFWEWIRQPLLHNMKEYHDFGALKGDLGMYTLGVIYERLWHVFFGMDPVYCPDVDYCKAVQWSGTVGDGPDTIIPAFVPASDQVDGEDKVAQPPTRFGWPVDDDESSTAAEV